MVSCGVKWFHASFGDKVLWHSTPGLHGRELLELGSVCATYILSLLILQVPSQSSECCPCVSQPSFQYLFFHKVLCWHCAWCWICSNNKDIVSHCADSFLLASYIYCHCLRPEGWGCSQRGSWSFPTLSFWGSFYPGLLTQEQTCLLTSLLKFLTVFTFLFLPYPKPYFTHCTFQAHYHLGLSIPIFKDGIQT